MNASSGNAYTPIHIQRAIDLTRLKGARHGHAGEHGLHEIARGQRHRVTSREIRHHGPIRHGERIEVGIQLVDRLG